MVGIGQYGLYLPRFRLPRRLIAEAWGGRRPAGEIAVANYDEDAFTLAVEAATNCMGKGPADVDGVFFASTTSPYCEKQMASVIATACDAPRRVFSADFGGSVRAGVTAVLHAVRTVQAGAAGHVLVAAADVRAAAPASPLEGVLGDGAAAVTVTDRDVIAEFVDASSVSEEFTHVWRTDRARTVEMSGGKFSNTYGYGRDLGDAIRALLERQKLEPGAIARLALYSPDARAAATLAKSLGFNPETQLAESLLPQVGCTGCAEPLLLLGGILDAAQPGQLVLLGSCAEGADVLLLRVTDGIDSGRQSISLRRWIESKEEISSYQCFLKYRRLIDVEEIVELVTNVIEFKELRQDVRLYGSRCLECGTVQYPMARVCIRCKAREHMEAARLARRGTVFTCTVDHLIPSFRLPLPMAVVDMDGGGRLYLQVTDTDTIEIGRRVVLTYRRLHEGGGRYNYYWKARPPREEDNA